MVLFSGFFFFHSTHRIKVNLQKVPLVESETSDVVINVIINSAKKFIWGK